MGELNLTTEQKRSLFILFAIITGVAGFYFLNSRLAKEELALSIQSPKPIESVAPLVIINVVGKVVNPGYTNYLKGRTSWRWIKSE